MNFRFLSPALEELAEAATYDDNQVPGLGADFLIEVDRLGLSSESGAILMTR
jgi:hypothetical protein